MSKIHNPVVGMETSVASSNEATIVVLRAVIDNERYEWTGTSKRNPDDKYCSIVGEKLALARALRAASFQLARQANGLVKNVEDNRIASIEARSRPIPKAYRVTRKANARNTPKKTTKAKK